MAQSTTNNIALSHVAVLVPSVRKAADHLAQFGFNIGKEQEWEGEGTREIYIEQDKANSLLLIEAFKPGPYRRAMEKRGPGLHHVAIDVLDLEPFLESLTGSGWLLHPASVRTIKQSQTAYLARPGFPALIEVQGREELYDDPIFITQVSLKFDPSLENLLNRVGLNSIVYRSEDRTLTMGDRTVRLDALSR